MGAKTLPRRADPPPQVTGGRPAVWPGLLAAVRKAGGAWMLVSERPDGVKAAALAFKVRQMHDPAKEFEIIARGNGIYARLKTA